MKPIRPFKGPPSYNSPYREVSNMPKAPFKSLYREYKLMDSKMKKNFLLAYGGKALQQTLKWGGIALGLYFLFAAPIWIVYEGFDFIQIKEATGAFVWHFAMFVMLLLAAGALLLAFCVNKGIDLYDNIKSATFLVEKHLEDVGYKEKE